jgi:hypothetical protein
VVEAVNFTTSKKTGSKANELESSIKEGDNPVAGADSLVCRPRVTRNTRNFGRISEDHLIRLNTVGDR